MNRAFTIIIFLPWIPLFIIQQYFGNLNKLSCEISKVLIFPIGMFFSLYLYYFFSKIEEAEELEEFGILRIVKFFNKKRFIVSLIISGIILIFTIVLYFTTGFDIILDLLDEDEYVGVIVILIFFMVLYFFRKFAIIMYKYLK